MDIVSSIEFKIPNTRLINNYDVHVYPAALASRSSSEGDNPWHDEQSLLVTLASRSSSEGDNPWRDEQSLLVTLSLRSSSEGDNPWHDEQSLP